MSQHALLSPSSAHRWLACPASVAASAGLQDTPSEHAVVGTVAHDIAACALETGTDAPDTHPELQARNSPRLPSSHVSHSRMRSSA